MILTYIHTSEGILKAVKQESSLLAVRRTDEQGTPTFDQLVFDEGYMILFRELFFDARANVVSACSTYMKDMIDTTAFEASNFNKDVDFAIQLNVEGFITAFNDSVDIKMRAYIVAYIMYRWLETKLPKEAEIYLMRATTHLHDMVRFLEMRKPRKIRKSWV